MVAQRIQLTFTFEIHHISPGADSGSVSGAEIGNRLLSDLPREIFHLILGNLSEKNQGKFDLAICNHHLRPISSQRDDNFEVF
jgi:hypothetical protein